MTSKLILFFIIITNSYTQDLELMYTSEKALYDVVFSDSLNGYAVGDSGTILNTSDGGSNWNTQNSNTGHSLYSVFPITSNKLISCGNGLILFTNNLGNSWNVASTPTDYPIYNISFTDSLTGWAVAAKFLLSPFYTTVSLILKTNDGGVSWLQIGDTLAGGFRDIQFVNPDTGWICGTDQFFDHLNKPLILKTIDGGKTWNNQELPFDQGPLNSLYFVDSDNGWATGYGVSSNSFIYSTKNGGDTWESIGWFSNKLPLLFRDIFFLNINKGWTIKSTALYEYSVVTSEWSLLRDSLDSVNSITLHRNDMWFTSFSGKIYRYKDLITSILKNKQVPSKFEVFQNTPNPFNAQTSIHFKLTIRTKITISVYDIQGKLIILKEIGPLNAGKYKTVIDLSKYASGLYTYSVKANDESYSKKMILLK